MISVMEASLIAPDISGAVLGYDPKCTDLDLVRDTLEHLNDEKDDHIDEYCFYVPDQLTRRKENDPHGRNWRQWLGRGATAMMLEDFLDWHHGSLASIQMSGDFEGHLRDEFAAFKRATHRAVQSGHAHPDLALAVDDPNRIPQVQLSDVFDEELPGLGAYYDKHNRLISLVTGRSGENQAEVPRSVLWHEFNHEYIEVPSSWMSEAAVEHFTQFYANGRAGIILPRVRPNDDLTYDETRTLWWTLNTQGKQAISQNIWLRAVTESEMYGPAFCSYSDKVDAAWSGILRNPGADVLSLVDFEMARYTLQAAELVHEADAMDWAAAKLIQRLS